MAEGKKAEFIAVKKIDQKAQELRDENINISEIRSFRQWHKKEEVEWHKGDITVIYVKNIQSEDGRNKDHRILIAESEESFGERVGVIPI